MPYESSNKTGKRTNPAVLAACAASMAASGPNSLGDGAMSSTMAPTPQYVSAIKASRFQDNPN